MEPIALKCPHCETEWKLFKASLPILCPKCQEPVPPPEGFAPEPEPPPPAPLPDATVDPNAPPPLPAMPTTIRPFREPLILDAHERDYADPDDDDDVLPRRRGTHPLVKVILILLLLFVLLPVALVVGLFALCALSLR